MSKTESIRSLYYWAVPLVAGSQHLQVSVIMPIACYVVIYLATALLASRIGFSAVLSTDNVRQIMRKFISRGMPSFQAVDLYTYLPPS